MSASLSASPSAQPAETGDGTPPAPSIGPGLKDCLPLIIGFAIMLVPTLATLGRESWSVEIGAHGPIVLATGVWLLFQARAEIFAQARPAPLWLVLLALLPALALYIFGRAFDLLLLEAAGCYGVLLAITIKLAGIRALIRNFFPFLYLGFLVPLPGWVLDKVTVPLRELVSTISTHGLEALGYPIAREGITIYIAQYRLLVEDACSGMNSLVGLTAISLFYIYVLHRASWRHAATLLACVIPIAIFVNIIRVIGIILLTYYFGDAVAQGFLHNTTGMILFGLAILLVMLCDLGIQRFSRWRAKR